MNAKVIFYWPSQIPDAACALHIPSSPPACEEVIGHIEVPSPRNFTTAFRPNALNISIAAASKEVSDVIDVMFVYMKLFIIWPDIEQLQPKKI